MTWKKDGNWYKARWGNKRCAHGYIQPAGWLCRWWGYRYSWAIILRVPGEEPQAAASGLAATLEAAQAQAEDAAARLTGQGRPAPEVPTSIKRHVSITSQHGIKGIILGKAAWEVRIDGELVERGCARSLRAAQRQATCAINRHCR